MIAIERVPAPYVGAFKADSVQVKLPLGVFITATPGGDVMQQRVVHHPPYWMAVLVALLIYANFFSHHYIGDFRWYIAAATLGLYARTTVYFTPLDRERKMPLLLGFILVGFFIWLAENISTLLGLWSYPNQLGAWSVVHIGKWSSWSLLVIMTFTIVAQLKYVKARIDIPQ